MTAQFRRAVRRCGSSLYAKLRPCPRARPPQGGVLGRCAICMPPSDRRREPEIDGRYGGGICGAVSQRKRARVEESVKLWPAPIVSHRHPQHSSPSSSLSKGARQNISPSPLLCHILPLLLFCFTSFELCTLSSHLITSHIVQSEGGNCLFLVPTEAWGKKWRDEKGKAIKAMLG